MSHGLYSVFPITMTSGNTLTSNVDLSRAWATVHLYIPTMTSATDIYLKAAYSAAANYVRIHEMAANTASVQSNSFTIGSAVSQKMIEVPHGFQFMKVEFSTATTATSQQFVFVCSDV